MTIGRLLPLVAYAASGIIMGASMSAAQAADNGRYQAEVIQGGATPQVLFLDTRDGHFWVWSQMIRGSDQQLRYQGRLRPGASEGETIFETGARHPRR